MAEQKQTKLEVDYRRGTPRKKCGNCTMFIVPDGCTAVKGDISPQGVCDLYKSMKGFGRGLA